MSEERKELSLKEIRRRIGMTQIEAADYLGIARITYFNYEKKPEKQDKKRYRELCEKLNRVNETSPEDTVLSLDRIIRVCSEVLPKNTAAYLAGEYAENEADKDCHVILMVSGIGQKEKNEIREKLEAGLMKNVTLLVIQNGDTLPKRLFQVIRIV